MKNRNSIFVRFEKSRKLQVLFFLICMSVILITYFLGLHNIENIKTIKRKVSQDKNILYDIENIQNKGNDLLISGWVLRQESQNLKVTVILKNDLGQNYVLQTNLKEREEINTFYSENFDFGKTGFEFAISQNKLEKNSSYEIYLQLEYNLPTENNSNKIIKISSGYYLFNETLYRYQVEEYSVPKFIDSHMQQVIENGYLCIYDVEKDFSVYQYENSIYWIAGKDFSFNENGNTYLFCHFYYWNNEHLPESAKKYGFENKDFYFEDKEICFSSEELYRVSKIQLPEYMLKQLYMGVYDVDSAENILSYQFGVKR